MLGGTTAFAQTGTPSAGPVSAPLTLQQLEQLALQANPTVQQANAAVDAAQARARQAGAWFNPVIGYTGREITPGEVSRWGEHGVFVEQTVPLGGKLRRARDVFTQSATVAQSFVALQRQRILTSARTLFYEALTADRRIQVFERLAGLSSEAVDVSRQLYNTGAADRPDVLESEIESRRTNLDLEAARNGRFAVWQRIAALVNDPSLTPRPLEGSIEAAMPELERAQTLQALVERSPAVEAARAEVLRAQAVTAQARRVTYPDLFVRGGANYNRELLEIGARPVGWEAEAEAGVSVPIFNRNSGGIAAARAEETRAQAELRRVQLSLTAQMAGAFETYLTALRASEEYRQEIVPRAEEAYQLYLARYRDAAAAYPQVLIAQRTLLLMNTEYLDNVDNAWRAALRLQGLLAGDGLDLPGELAPADARDTTMMTTSTGR